MSFICKNFHSYSFEELGIILTTYCRCRCLSKSIFSIRYNSCNSRVTRLFRKWNAPKHPRNTGLLAGL